MKKRARRRAWASRRLSILECPKDRGSLPMRALFEKALQLAPRSADAHRDLGRLLWLQGRREEGLSHLRRALEIDPSQADCSNDLGTAYRESGDLEAAEARYRKAIELDSSHVGAHYNLAETLKLQGRLDEAAALDERVLALKPDIFRRWGL